MSIFLLQNVKVRVQNVSGCGTSFLCSAGQRCIQREGESMIYYDIEPDDCRDLPRVLKPDEVADFLCVHKNTVYKLIRQGLLPAFRVGKSWRIYRNDLPKLSTFF